MSHRSKGSWGKSHEIILKKPVSVKKTPVSPAQINPKSAGCMPLVVFAVIALSGFAVHLFI